MLHTKPESERLSKHARPKLLPPPGRTPIRRSPELQQWIDRVKALPEVRQDKVQSIREALADGTYDLDRRLAELLSHPPDDLADLADH